MKVPATTWSAALAALDISCDDAVASRLPEEGPVDPARYADRIVDTTLAERLWREWQPHAHLRLEDERFSAAWRKLLADAVALGLRLQRVQAVTAMLVQAEPDGKEWRAAFEGALDADDVGCLRVRLSRAHYDALRAGPSWNKALADATDAIFYRLGLVFVPPAISLDDRLQPPWVRLEWNDLALPPQKGLLEHEALVEASVEHLQRLGVSGEAMAHPLTGAECTVVDRSLRSEASNAGLACRDWHEHLASWLEATVRRAAPGLMNRTLWQLYRLRLRDFHADLMTAADRALEPDRIVQVLRALLSEGIGIRNAPVILQALLEVRSTIQVSSKDIVFEPASGGVYPLYRSTTAGALSVEELVEWVRWRLRRQISHQFTRGQNTLIVYLIDQATEERLLDPRALSAAEETALLEAVRTEVGSLPSAAANPVILTTSPVRQRLNRLIAPDHPKLAVVSYQELSPEMNIQPIARISPAYD